MPLYEYECKKCGHRFEKIHQRFSDPPEKTCPKCGGRVEQLLSAPAVQFKGTGWYVTDYGRKGSSGSSSKHESGGGADKVESSADKSDSKPKPESKPESKSPKKK